MINKNNICGYCKQENSKILFSTYDMFGTIYDIRKCYYCRAYFLAPRPDEATLAKAYDSSYYGEKEERFNPYIEKILNIFRKKRARLVYKNVKEGNVLDIGCGNGKFLFYLSRFGDYKLFGTELDGNSAKRAMKIPEINLKIGALENDDFEAETFDAITMFQVFEHLQEPGRTLKIISKIIKKNGILIISFPNIDSFQSKLFRGKWLHIDPPRHLFFFKPKDFVNLMKDFGFEILESHYFSIEQNPFGMIQSILNCFLRKREVLFEKLKENKTYAEEYSGFFVFLQKIFFIITFPIFIFTDIIESFLGKGGVVEFVFRKVK